MADTTHNALVAAIRAMDEVIVPAVDPSHPLAREQARLVTGFLRLLDARIDYLGGRDRFELRFHRDQASALLPAASGLSPAIAETLTDLITMAADLLASPSTPAGELRAHAASLAAVTTALVRTSADADDRLRAEIERIVLAQSKTWLDVQRAWFFLQGWEPGATDLPDLGDALSG